MVKAISKAEFKKSITTMTEWVEAGGMNTGWQYFFKPEKETEKAVSFFL